MKKVIYCLCWLLEHLCRLTHPFTRLEVKLTGNYCNICDLAYYLDKKLGVGYWKKSKTTTVTDAEALY